MKTQALEDLRTLGYHKANIFEVMNEAGKAMFKNNQSFFEAMSTDKRIQDYANSLGGPSRITSGKQYEMTHHLYLGRALGLRDASIIKLYIHDYFTSIAEEFLEVDDPKIFNVLAWIHPANQHLGRQGSQNWHRDRAGSRMLNIFIYYSNVTEDNGPFQYVPQSFIGAEWGGLNAGRNKYEDYALPNGKAWPFNQQEKDVCEKTHISLTGKAGDIILCNNTGFHRGGFVKKSQRNLTHCFYLAPDAELIKDGTYPSFNYDTGMINSIDFNSEEFNKLGEKCKHFKI